MTEEPSEGEDGSGASRRASAPRYESLVVWQHAHRLVLAVYKETRSFPASVRYELTSQMRRAAASVPSNLAEGVGRDSRAELARYSRIALGSVTELQYQLLLARDLGYLPDGCYRSLADQSDHVRRMLAKFVKSLV